MDKTTDKKRHPILNRVMVFIIICLLLLASIFYLQLKLQEAKTAEQKAKLEAQEAAKKPKIDIEALQTRLEAAAELTTAELYYQGIIKYTDGKIPFLTQKAFSMSYSAKVRAGADASKISLHADENTIIATLPQTEIQSIDVDPDSIRFYDEKFALLNWTKKEDAIEAIKAAIEDLQANADLQPLKDKATEELRILTENMLGAVADGRKVIIY
ncbi:MAG: DUF4230 domain-containing protein [Firmicutes bacterium]|nr:DUF4230 domain-containing protein [Bacillota bacterium]